MAENHGEVLIKKSNPKKIVIVAVCVAVVIVAAFVGIYYLVPPNSEHPQDISVVTNFSDGAYANYVIVSYDDAGAVKGRGILNNTITDGTYDGKSCWVSLENYTFAYINGTVVNDLVTCYLDKSTYSNVQTSQQSYVNGELAYNETWGPDAADSFDDVSLFSNMTVIATDQSVSVPAGTFSTTEREGKVEADVTLTIWMNNAVPVWGEVKSNYTRDGQIICTYTLESYGS